MYVGLRKHQQLPLRLNFIAIYDKTPRSNPSEIQVYNKVMNDPKWNYFVKPLASHCIVASIINGCSIKAKLGWEQ